MVVLPSNEVAGTRKKLKPGHHEGSLDLRGNRVRATLASAAVASWVKEFFVEVPNHSQLPLKLRLLLRRRDSECLPICCEVVANHMAFAAIVMCSGIHLALNILKLVIELVFA